MTGPPEKIAEFIRAFTGLAVQWLDQMTLNEQKLALCFNALLTVPPEVCARGFNEAGYQWCIDNWGTKWDIHGDASFTINPENKLIVAFDTAWTAPIELFQNIVNNFPTLIFDLLYLELGNDVIGHIQWVGGEEFALDHGGSETVEQELNSIYELIRLNTLSVDTFFKQTKDWDE